MSDRLSRLLYAIVILAFCKSSFAGQFMPKCEAVSISLSKPTGDGDLWTISVKVKNCGRHVVNMLTADLPWMSGADLKYWIQPRGNVKEIESLYPIVDAQAYAKVTIQPGSELVQTEDFRVRFPDLRQRNDIDGALIKWRFVPRPGAYCALAENCGPTEGVLGKVCMSSLNFTAPICEPLSKPKSNSFPGNK
ncbi:hypothetical protein LRH25_32470 [Ideonella azotifigens]|uniref:hypothetical protein n=1 Tax=Ideonella azotifigens TaxID=513160 RepID=UPI001143D286|nr:hypothetical protein [Ideonella azotifigens]MCD2345031.1 hypothetical protein [Ideonella azotifigens]